MRTSFLIGAAALVGTVLIPSSADTFTIFKTDSLQGMNPFFSTTGGDFTTIANLATNLPNTVVKAQASASNMQYIATHGSKLPGGGTNQDKTYPFIDASLVCAAGQTCGAANDKLFDAAATATPLPKDQGITVAVKVIQTGLFNTCAYLSGDYTNVNKATPAPTTGLPLTLGAMVTTNKPTAVVPYPTRYFVNGSTVTGYSGSGSNLLFVSPDTIHTSAPFGNYDFAICQWTYAMNGQYLTHAVGVAKGTGTLEITSVQLAAAGTVQLGFYVGLGGFFDVSAATTPFTGVLGASFDLNDAATFVSPLSTTTGCTWNGSTITAGNNKCFFAYAPTAPTHVRADIVTSDPIAMHLPGPTARDLNGYGSLTTYPADTEWTAKVSGEFFVLKTSASGITNGGNYRARASEVLPLGTGGVMFGAISGTSTLTKVAATTVTVPPTYPLTRPAITTSTIPTSCDISLNQISNSNLFGATRYAAGNTSGFTAGNSAVNFNTPVGSQSSSSNQWCSFAAAGPGGAAGTVTFTVSITSPAGSAQDVFAVAGYQQVIASDDIAESPRVNYGAGLLGATDFGTVTTDAWTRFTASNKSILQNNAASTATVTVAVGMGSGGTFNRAVLVIACVKQGSGPDYNTLGDCSSNQPGTFTVTTTFTSIAPQDVTGNASIPIANVLSATNLFASSSSFGLASIIRPGSTLDTLACTSNSTGIYPKAGSTCISVLSTWGGGAVFNAVQAANSRPLFASRNSSLLNSQYKVYNATIFANATFPSDVLVSIGMINLLPSSVTVNHSDNATVASDLGGAHDIELFDTEANPFNTTDGKTPPYFGIVPVLIIDTTLTTENGLNVTNIHAALALGSSTYSSAAGILLATAVGAATLVAFLL